MTEQFEMTPECASMWDSFFGLAVRSSVSSHLGNGAGWLHNLQRGMESPRTTAYYGVADPAGRLILAAIGCGMRLRITHDYQPGDVEAVQLVEGHPKIFNRPRVNVPREHHAIVFELRNNGTLYRMTRKNIEARGGWEECGLDGTDADFYCLFV